MDDFCEKDTSLFLFYSSSIDDEENKTSQWYHHQQPDDLEDLMDPLEHILNDDDIEVDEEELENPDFKLSQETKEKLQDSWKTLQERYILSMYFRNNEVFSEDNCTYQHDIVRNCRVRLYLSKILTFFPTFIN